jgi:L-ascorbate metabolism protein UlaG (beta-lactamase superfamily)
MSDKRRFVNLDGSGPQPLSSVLKWGVVDRLAGRRRRSPPRATVPRVTADAAVLARAPAPGEPARLTWVGHASWLVQLDGVSLLVDPVLFDTIGGAIRRNVPPGVSLDALPRIDAQLVTHNHYDHLDLPTLGAVGAPVIAGLGIGRYLSRARLGCTELDWWQSTEVGAVSVTFVPSHHWSRRGLTDTNQSLWGGFVIDGSSARLYHSGDTAYFAGFAEIGRRFCGIDAALLPIGAYDPAWFMERQHLNPEQAVQSFLDLGAREFFAMHWGTFKLTDEPLLEPPERLHAEWRRRGLSDAHKRVPKIGESFHVARE